jgi:hypothetical protein
MLESVTVIVPEYMMLFNLKESVYVLFVRPVIATRPNAGAGADDPAQG